MYVLMLLWTVFSEEIADCPYNPFRVIVGLRAITFANAKVIIHNI